MYRGGRNPARVHWSVMGIQNKSVTAVTALGNGKTCGDRSIIGGGGAMSLWLWCIFGHMKAVTN